MTVFGVVGFVGLIIVGAVYMFMKERKLDNSNDPHEGAAAFGPHRVGGAGATTPRAASQPGAAAQDDKVVAPSQVAVRVSAPQREANC